MLKRIGKEMPRHNHKRQLTKNGRLWFRKSTNLSKREQYVVRQSIVTREANWVLEPCALESMMLNLRVNQKRKHPMKPRKRLQLRDFNFSLIKIPKPLRKWNRLLSKSSLLCEMMYLPEPIQFDHLEYNAI